MKSRGWIVNKAFFFMFDRIFGCAMHKRMRIIWTFLVGMILLVDPLVYSQLGTLLNAGSGLYRLLYWSLPVVFMVWLYILIRFHSFYDRNPSAQKKYFLFFGFFILIYIPKLFFMLPSLMEWLINRAIDMISMYNIELQILSHISGVIAGVLFLLILYGMVYGRFHFKKEQVVVNHQRLPERFDGFRIVQISDIHIGSWAGHQKKMQQAVDLINREKPDLIVFTGDLFNNYYEEIIGFQDILKGLEAPYGKYAVLGNHDYGDYFHWLSREEYRQNFQRVKSAYREAGFRLLLNEGLTLSRGNEQIGLAGVENWGLPPFHQYGDLTQAMAQLNGTTFNILLSHDPSHWRARVLNNENIHLTLSGHTHGMQFGIYTSRFRWSPSKAKYPEWGGLYTKGPQHLYVNKGLGYIGFPGRIGIRPEITLITLHKKEGTGTVPSASS